jgi:hypothetical protein
MINAKKLRIEYNNNWPLKELFPVEKELTKLLKDNCIYNNPLKVAHLSYSEERKFHFYLGFLIDALDMLPLRPDLAFDHLWKALDSEFFDVQKESQTPNTSRFDDFVNRILNDQNTVNAFFGYLPIIPYQTTEYAAKRVIMSSLQNDNDEKALYRRAKSSLGDDFVREFLNKYPLSGKNKPAPSIQRNAGRLLRLIFSGNEVTLGNKTFSFTDNQKASFLIKVILTNYRNERFHGIVFSPFRSSMAKLETYSHAYYLMHLSYALLLEVFLYRNYNVITSQEVERICCENIEIFRKVFSEIGA